MGKKLEAAFEALKKKYPGAAKELEKEFLKAIRRVSAKIKKPTTEIHLITVEANGPDGKKYIVEFEAVMPASSQILSVNEKLIKNDEC